jgi:hypothetical protein
VVANDERAVKDIVLQLVDARAQTLTAEALDHVVE